MQDRQHQEIPIHSATEKELLPQTPSFFKGVSYFLGVEGTQRICFGKPKETRSDFIQFPEKELPTSFDEKKIPDF